MQDAGKKVKGTRLKVQGEGKYNLLTGELTSGCREKG